MTEGLGRDRRRRRSQIALTGVVLGALGAVAIASGAAQTKTAEITLAPGELGTASAKCKRGRQATSGGFNVPGFTADTEIFVLATASVRKGRRTWSSSAENAPTSPSSGKLVDFAYCSRGIRRVTTKTERSTSVPNGGLESLTPRCPRGSEAVSGGFETPGSAQNQVAVFESRRIKDRTWRVTGQGTSGSEARLNAFVYCAEDKLGLSVKRASDSTSQDNTDLAATARCKKGQRAVSGGFAMKGAGAYVTVFRSRRARARSWKAAAANYSGDDPVTWSAYAYCLEKGGA